MSPVREQRIQQTLPPAASEFARYLNGSRQVTRYPFGSSCIPPTCGQRVCQQSWVGAPGRKKFELFDRHARSLDRISRSCVNSNVGVRRRSLMCAGSSPHDQSYDSASSILNMSPPDKLKADLPTDPFLGTSGAQILPGTKSWRLARSEAPTPSSAQRQYGCSRDRFVVGRQLRPVKELRLLFPGSRKRACLIATRYRPGLRCR